MTPNKIKKRINDYCSKPIKIQPTEFTSEKIGKNRVDSGKPKLCIKSSCWKADEFYESEMKLRQKK